MIDLDSYCARVGYEGPRQPTLEALRALHRLHPQAIAFENFDPLLGRPVPLDAPSLERKIVHGGRGGYCYEQNLLLAHALRAFGFEIVELAGRVVYNLPAGITLPRTHILLKVAAEGQDYLVDVGFGGNVLTGPLLFDSDAEQGTPHEPFQIVPADDGRILQAKIRDKWVKLYWFDESVQLQADHELGNWYVATHPNSRFVKGLMVARAEPGRRYALANNELSIHALNGGTEKRLLNSPREMRDALGDLFALRLADLRGLDAALARLTAVAV